MKDIDLYPVEAIIESLMARDNVFDVAIVISHGDTPDDPNWKYTYQTKGDPNWLRKKIEYNLLPAVEEAIEEAEEAEEEEENI